MAAQRLRILLLAASLACALHSIHGQKQHDTLSSGQVDQVRELGDNPLERLKLFLKFVNERAAAIKELTPNSTENNRPAELRARFEEFTRLADELSDNVDTYDSDHADIRKALRAIVDSSAKWPAILKAPAPDRTYDFSRKTALDAAESASEQAGKLLASEETYFAAHKDEVGKNGKAPTPEL
jgi:phage host-nuclease inhibitor protein Gam